MYRINDDSDDIKGPDTTTRRRRRQSNENGAINEKRKVFQRTNKKRWDEMICWHGDNNNKNNEEIDTWEKEESHNQFVIRTIIIIIIISSSSRASFCKNKKIPLQILYNIDKRRDQQQLRNYNELIDIIQHRWLCRHHPPQPSIPFNKAQIRSVQLLDAIYI